MRTCPLHLLSLRTLQLHVPPFTMCCAIFAVANLDVPLWSFITFAVPEKARFHTLSTLGGMFAQRMPGTLPLY